MSLDEISSTPSAGNISNPGSQPYSTWPHGRLPGPSMTLHGVACGCGCMSGRNQLTGSWPMPIYHGGSIPGADAASPKYTPILYYPRRFTPRARHGRRPYGLDSSGPSPCGTINANYRLHRPRRGYSHSVGYVAGGNNAVLPSPPTPGLVPTLARYN